MRFIKGEVKGVVRREAEGAGMQRAEIEFRVMTHLNFHLINSKSSSISHPTLT